MKRISDDQIQEAVRKWIDEDYSTRSISLDRGHWEYIAPVIADAQMEEDRKKMVVLLLMHRGIKRKPTHPDIYFYFTFTSREWEALVKGEKDGIRTW